MLRTPHGVNKSDRLPVRLSQPALDASKRCNRAYLALHPDNRLDDLYRPLLAKLARDLEAQCRKRGIDVAKGAKQPDTVPTHIRRKKSPTYDEL